MKIFAQSQKVVTSSHTGQTQFLRSFAEPLTQDLLPLGVIVPHAQVLLEIALGITETVLSFGGQHFTSAQLKVGQLEEKRKRSCCGHFGIWSSGCS